MTKEGFIRLWAVGLGIWLVGAAVLLSRPDRTAAKLWISAGAALLLALSTLIG